MKLNIDDPKLFTALMQERERQEYGLEMIASENYASEDVMTVQGSVLTNKYAEGYPKKRYYGGCQFIDITEQLAIERATQLFECEFANVQPHSGANANLAAYLSLVKPGDTIMGLDLSHGGHLTHGSSVNFSGFLFQSITYKLNPETERLDYKSILNMAKEHKPQMIIAGYSAYPRVLDFAKFKEIADVVGAKLLVDMAHFAGLVAGGAHPSPIPFADVTTTTTHKTLRGPRGGLILSNAANAKSINSKIFPGIQGGPLQHIIAAKAVAFQEALKPEFKTYAQNVISNAQTLGETLKSRGLKLVTDGTDNHLLLVDLSKTELTGKVAEASLDLAGITVNKNTVPNEKRSPFVTSGIRIGTPALTTRGMMKDEMKTIGHWIADVIENPENKQMLEKIHQDVKTLCKDFPIYKK